MPADETRVPPVRRSWRRRRDRAAPRACERPSTRTRARWPPPGRRLGWWRWWRDRRGRGSAQRKEKRKAGSAAQRSASGVWVLAPGVRGTWRERMGGGAAEDEASRARIKTGPFLSLALKPSPRVLSVCYKKEKKSAPARVMQQQHPTKLSADGSFGLAGGLAIVKTPTPIVLHCRSRVLNF